MVVVRLTFAGVFASLVTVATQCVEPVVGKLVGEHECVSVTDPCLNQPIRELKRERLDGIVYLRSKGWAGYSRLPGRPAGK